MPPMSGVAFPEDLALAARCAAGDPEAWRVFVDRVGPRILSLARRMGLRDGAEDAAAEVFVRILEKDAHVLKVYRGQAPLEAYLHIVTRRMILESSGSLPRPLSLGGEALDLFEAKEGDAHRIRERRESVKEALAILPEAPRALLELIYLEGMSQREAAVRMGIPPGTASTWVSRSLRRMSREMGDS